IAGGAQATMLVLDAVLIRVHPLADTRDEFLAPQLVAVRALVGHLPLYDRLGGDACMILTGHPQRPVTEHAMVADHDVLQGRRDGVPEVERASDVGRRHADDEGSPTGILTRLEVAVVFPPLVEALLDRLWLIGLRNLVEPSLLTHRFAAHRHAS